jgi:hypothetical protein
MERNPFISRDIAWQAASEELDKFFRERDPDKKYSLGRWMDRASDTLGCAAEDLLALPVLK